MKLPKFMALVTVATAVCLLYVYQQTEIFRLAYTGQRFNSQLQELSNANAVLRYSIESSSSLIRIGDKLSQRTEFQMPDGYHMVRMSAPSTHPAIRRPERGENMLVRIFSVKRQAVAQTINTPANKRTVAE
jgi:hypothetical protein